MKMGTTEEISRFIVGNRYEDIPKEAVKVAKALILDCVGAMLGGSGTEPGKIVINHVKQVGGTPEVSIYGGGFSTSMQNAAFCNGSLSHVLELEAVGFWPGGNPMTVIPVALLTAENMKQTGRDVIQAVVVGYEVQGKIGMNSMGAARRGWGTLTLFGALGAAATAAKNLRLDLDRTRIALSIAASQAGGLYSQMGTMTHLIEAGIACRNGLVGALLSRAGITANLNILETARGFCEVAVGEGGYDLNKMTSELANPYYILSPGAFIKKYPFCFSSHRAIDATLGLVRENNIKYADVKEVEAGVNLFRSQQLWCPEPKNGEEARFCLPHCLAAAILRGAVGLEDVTDESAVSTRYQEARKKIKVVLHQEWPPGREFALIPITIRMNDGKEYTRQVEFPTGGPNAPIPDNEQMTRFADLARVALPSAQVDRVGELIMTLEKQDSLDELFKILRTPSKALRTGNKS